MFILNTPQNHNENMFNKFEIFKNLELQTIHFHIRMVGLQSWGATW